MAHCHAKKYRRRPGTTDDGRNFEDLITATLALKLTLDESIDDFSIKSNVDKYGAFDDLIFEIDKDHTKQQYCMQLKYKQNSERTLTKEALNSERGKYCLKKYCEDYLDIAKKQKIDFKGILMVKSQFTADKNEVLTNGYCRYSIQETSDADETTKFCKTLDKHCVCYQFVIDNNINNSDSAVIDNYRRFFDNFTLCVTNATVYEIEKHISDIFEEKFLQRPLSSRFLEFVRNLNKQCYGLEKTIMRYGITLIVLDPYMSPISFEMALTESQKLLLQAILTKTVTHLEDISCFTDFGRITKNQVTPNDVKDLSTLYNFDTNDNDKKCSKTLFLMKKCPLAIEYTIGVEAAIQLSPDLRYIVINTTTKHIEKVENITTLEDLAKNVDLYKTIVETFECKLQNKIINLKTLLNLDPEVLKLITINELFEIAYGKLNIDANTLVLPDTHISPRYFTDKQYTNTLINENELINNECKISIISAKPGMGKSTILKHLVYVAKANMWTVFLNASALPSLFREHKDSLSEFKKYLLKSKKQHLTQFEYLMLKIFIKRDAIRFLWDGIDEVNQSNYKNIISLIKQLQIGDTTHYITTRSHLLDDLETQFEEMKPRSLTLTEFNEEEQQYYIQHRLNLSEDQLEDTFSKIKLNIESLQQNDILAIPLQIFMLTELLKQNCTSDYNAQNFTIDRLYEYFIDKKLKVHFEERLKLNLDIDCVFEIVNKQTEEYRDMFENLSAQCFFEQDFDVKCEPKLLKTIKNNGDSTGFIIKLDEVSEHHAKAVFFHTSISEFFAAQFLFNRLGKIDKKFFLKFFKSDFYKNIRFFFNLMLARDCKAHTAILCKNWKMLDECTLEDLIKTDKGERDALKILILTNYTKYSSTIIYTTKNNRIIVDFPPEYINDFRSCDTTIMIEKIKVLLYKINLTLKDRFYCDVFDYLKEFKFFLILGIIYTELEKLPNDLLKTYKNDIIFACFLYDYSDILKVLKEIPIITTKRFQSRDNHFEHTLLYYKCANWIRKLSLDKYLRNKCNFDIIKSLSGDQCFSIVDNLSCYRYNENSGIEKKVDDIFKIIISTDKSSIVNRRDHDGKTLFFWLCKLASVESVNLLLDNGENIDATDDTGKMCLHFACLCEMMKSCHERIRHNQFFTVKTLLDRGVLVNARTKTNVTPLHYACLSSTNVDLLKLLLERNSDINAIDDDKCTVLHYACKGHVVAEEIIEFILQNGISVNCQDIHNNTPLHFATYEYCDTKVLECLIRNGANTNSINKNFVTPLHNAYQWNTKDDVELLLMNNADINAIDIDNRSVLHYACQNTWTSVESVEFILKQNISVNCKDTDNNTPLHFAVLNCHLDVIDCLIKNGANVNAANNKKQTPLHNSWSLMSRMPIVKLLLENNGDVNATDNNKSIALHIVCKYISPPLALIKELVARNTESINSKDIDNNTPLHFAAKHCTPEIVGYLIKNGGNINSINNKQSTPLHSTCEAFDININNIKLLLKNKADIKAVDSTKCTVLHIACKNSQTTAEIINELLLQHKKLVDYQDVDNNTSLHFAALFAKTEVVNCLIKHGANVNSVNNDNLTPLDNAHKAEDSSKIKLLTECKPQFFENSKNIFKR